MGNSFSPCLHAISTTHRRRSSAVKLIFHNGRTRTLAGNHHIAGEIMFEYPDMMVCHADSFFIGHPVPSMAINDHLLPGKTYFVLPVEPFASIDVLSTSTLAAIGAGKYAKFSGQCPFEYIHCANGSVLIKVVPEFIVRLISPGSADGGDSGGGSDFLCSTPELKRHYDQLVGLSKGRVWSPKLETISEFKIKHSPSRFIGFKVHHKQP